MLKSAEELCREADETFDRVMNNPNDRNRAIILAGAPNLARELHSTTSLTKLAIMEFDGPMLDRMTKRIPERIEDACRALKKF